MLQTDISLSTPNDWVPITCTGDSLHILAIYNGDILIRFGAGSTSNGIELVPGDTLSCNETIYVKVRRSYLKNVFPLISVAK